MRTHRVIGINLPKLIAYYKVAGTKFQSVDIRNRLRCTYLLNWSCLWILHITSIRSKDRDELYVYQPTDAGPLALFGKHSGSEFAGCVLYIFRQMALTCWCNKSWMRQKTIDSHWKTLKDASTQKQKNDWKGKVSFLHSFLYYKRL